MVTSTAWGRGGRGVKGTPDVGQGGLLASLRGHLPCGRSFCWVRRSPMPDAWSLMAAGLRGPFCPAPPSGPPLSPPPTPPRPGLGCAGCSRAGVPAFPVTWVPELRSPAAFSSTKTSPLHTPSPLPPPFPDRGDVSLRGGAQIPCPGEGRTTGREPRPLPPPPSADSLPPRRAAGPAENSPPPARSPVTSWARHLDGEFTEEP